ncbi:hypothetical protein AKJ16_DCAP24639 [Drosera capensis]
MMFRRIFISERTPSQIPPIAHEGNQYEQEITERCIALKRTTLQALVSEMVTKLDLRQIDRRRLMLNHTEMITSGAHVSIAMTSWFHSFYTGSGSQRLVFGYHLMFPTEKIAGMDMLAELSIIVLIMLAEETMSADHRGVHRCSFWNQLPEPDVCFVS